MTSLQRQILLSAISAYTGIPIEDSKILSIKPANSSRIRLSLPQQAAERLLQGFYDNDPLLKAFLESFDLLRVENVHQAVTDVSESGLEALIVSQMLERGWIQSRPEDYNREFAVDLAQLQAFLEATQPAVLDNLSLDPNEPSGRQFLARLQGQIANRGVIDVLRKGVSHGRVSQLDLFYGTPSPDNPKAVERFGQNRFSVTRQLRYSRDETQLALDLGLFINGLPVATFELKNSLTKQTVEDAIQQYKNDRDPREKLFEFGRCVVHFAVDDHEVRFCTHLKGKASWFLPF
ncbi:MAG: type I restriction endonuclease subunit R, partial [Anaerolineae bacterium]|nr:type I restriction endonuclease subunit R [Anaerolineae bacterium]